jgi:hypothetical protein
MRTIKTQSLKEHSSNKTAVIIVGNPKWIKGPHKELAKKFYGEIKAFLEERGYDVSYDAGKPHTIPETADMWLGHSRGEDRLRFAPEGIKTLALGKYEPEASQEHSETFEMGDDSFEPLPEHYEFTDSMRNAVEELCAEGDISEASKEDPYKEPHPWTGKIDTQLHFDQSKRNLKDKKLKKKKKKANWYR